MTFPPNARLAMGFMLAMVFSWLLFMLWRQDRRQLALRDWSIAYLLVALAAPIRASLGLTPDWLAIGAGGAVAALGFGRCWAGVRRFAGLPPWAGVGCAGGVVWLAALPLTLDSLQGRVMLISVIVGGYALLIAWELRNGMRRERLPSHPALIIAFLAFSALALTRAAFAWHFGFDAPHDTLPVTPWNDLLAVGILAIFAGTAVLLVALARERAEQLSNARLTRARDLANSASIQKSRFLARMSHELRTPLNAVYGMAQVLAEDKSLGPAQRDQAATLVQAGRHLLAIVNDALDLARVEAGRLDLASRPMPPRELLQGTLDLTAGAAAAKRIDLRLEAATDLPKMLVCDPLRLRQIAMNLLSNAIKFTPPGGVVLLAADWDPAQETLRLCVTDTGPGVPAELRARLFGEFAQGSLESASGEGSGLGLAISAALARAMGGSLGHAPGLDGQGSAFTLVLPAKSTPPDPAASSTKPEPAASLPTRPLHLLVVDDVRPNRLLARAMLEQAGHSVTEAEGAVAAIAKLECGPPPDAVLMDVNMLPLDGRAATRMIRALDGAVARVPIIAMTADTRPADVAACLEAGMDGHLAKPVDRGALLAELARATSLR